MKVFNNKFSVSDRLKSIGYAWDGLKIMLIEEHNFRVHLFVLISVILASFALHIDKNEWLTILLATGFVFSMEIMNTAIENLSDFITDERNAAIKKIKDLSAAAVLVSAIIAIVAGLIIFLPKVLALI
jgi:diacylglycerol kinase